MLQERHASVDTPDGPMPVFVARPAGRERCSVVIVYMDVFGPREELHDFCRRFARAGYAALLPNLFHRLGSPSFRSRTVRSSDRSRRPSPPTARHLSRARCATPAPSSRRSTPARSDRFPRELARSATAWEVATRWRPRRRSRTASRRPFGPRGTPGRRHAVLATSSHRPARVPNPYRLRAGRSDLSRRAPAGDRAGSARGRAACHVRVVRRASWMVVPGPLELRRGGQRGDLGEGARDVRWARRSPTKPLSGASRLKGRSDLRPPRRLPPLVRRACASR